MVTMSSDDVKVTAAPSRRPKQRRWRDMALSLAVLAVPLVLFIVAWQWAADRPVSVVDPSEDYAVARAYGIDAVEPDLPDGWRTVSSTLAHGGGAEGPALLRVGWYSPDGHGFQVVQTRDAALTQIDESIAETGDTVDIDGATWAVYRTDAGTAWVAESTELTVVLLTDADGLPELPELARGVR
jgi:hypothetical protein